MSSMLYACHNLRESPFNIVEVSGQITFGQWSLHLSTRAKEGPIHALPVALMHANELRHKSEVVKFLLDSVCF